MACHLHYYQLLVFYLLYRRLLLLLKFLTVHLEDFCISSSLTGRIREGLALLLIVVLGVSFSLVPAALWPSVPKIIDPVILGSAYSLIFWIQNVGLCFVPLIIGIAFEKTGGYVVPMIIFASFGVLAFIMSFFLKVEDRKKGYGLELPNIKK